MVALPPSEKEEFERVLLGPGGVEELSSYVVAVDVRNGQAFKKRDKEKIDRTIETELGSEGFSIVNGAICARLRDWLQEAAMEVAESVGETDSSTMKASKWHLAGDLLHHQSNLVEAKPLLRP